MPASRKQASGFTLIEILAVMGVSLMLFGLVAKTFFQSQDAVGHSVDKIESVQNARQLVDKLGPIVAVACDPTELASHPVTLHLPEEGLTEEMNSPTWLDITTTEDFFADEFSTQKREFRARSELQAHRYRVEYVPLDGQLLLKKMRPDLSEEDPDFQPKLIASRLTGLQFRPIINDDSLLEVRVRVTPETTLRPTGSLAPIETSAALYIPSESLR